MRLILIAASIVALVVAGFTGLRVWQYYQLWPEASSEVVQLTQEKRVILERLRPHRINPARLVRRLEAAQSWREKTPGVMVKASHLVTDELWRGGSVASATDLDDLARTRR